MQGIQCHIISKGAHCPLEYCLELCLFVFSLKGSELYNTLISDMSPYSTSMKNRGLKKESNEDLETAVSCLTVDHWNDPPMLYSLTKFLVQVLKLRE